jgi:hypothetical protein
VIVLGALVVGCGGVAAKNATTPPTRSGIVGHSAVDAEPVQAERPVTSAKLMLMTDFSFAPSMGEPYRQYRPFPLAGGGAGFLAEGGTRAIATLTEVKRIEGPTRLWEVCVARDGKATVALSRDPAPVGPDEGKRLWLADSFDGPMRQIGSHVTDIMGYAGGTGGSRERHVWFVDDAKGRSVVECESGSVEHVAPPASSPVDPWPRSAAELYWSDAIQILRLDSTKLESTYCLVRTQERRSWARHPACQTRSRGDGSLAVDLVPLPKTHTQAKCLFILDEQGKTLGCDAPVGPTKQVVDRRRDEAEASLPFARFYADAKVVVPGPSGSLFRLGADGKLDKTNRIGTASLQGCTPLLPTRPIFRCVADEKFDAVAYVDPDGHVREELRRRRSQTQDEVAIRRAGGDQYADAANVFHVTSDGGIAIGGDCDGNLGNVACVRSSNGNWRIVPFSHDLITALNRTAPATHLVPTPDGQLYVGTGAFDGSLGGEIQVLIFRADKGVGTAIKRIPAWILGSLAGLDAPRGAGAAPPPSLAWSTSQRVRVWPLEREHPAFHTKESCRVDIALDGTFDTDCVQGRLFAVGRLGLWEKGRGELYETLDAGQSWVPVLLPKGLETDDIVCSALGCRIGPYWRMGWGQTR